jgi:hypothetical protein
MSTTTLSWLISLGVAAAGAFAFAVVAVATGETDGVALVGGASWVFLLAVIIALPARARAGA